MRDTASSSWGLAQGCAPNETFVLGDYELRFDVSAIKGVRPNMEDRWNVAVRPDGAAAVLAVYDGHGGERVSHYLMSSLSAHVLADEHLETDPEGALRRACASCDERSVLDSPGVNPSAPPGFGRPRGPGAGSTAVIALLLPPRMFVANVGDSRAIAADAAGEIFFQSVDQRPSLPEERARVLELGGTVRVVAGVARAAGVLAVSRAFGNAGLKQFVRADPEVTEVDLSRLDTCILCSDGLTDVVDAAKAMETARGDAARRGTPSPSTRRRGGGDRRASVASEDSTMEPNAWGGKRRVANALTSLAKMRQSMDNICVLTFRARRAGTDASASAAASLVAVAESAEVNVRARRASAGGDGSDSPRDAKRTKVADDDAGNDAPRDGPRVAA
jgi:protein phosphatase 1L